MNLYTPVIAYRELESIVDEITMDMAVNWQNHDGGWSVPSPPVPTRTSDVWTTAEVVIWLALVNPKVYRDRIEDALGFLGSVQHTTRNIDKGKQVADGGWGSRKDRPSESNGTALSLLAYTTYLRRTGAQAAPFAENLKAACDWLIHAMHGVAGMPLLPGGEESLAFNTCWSVLALADSLAIPELADPIVPGVVARTLHFISTAQRTGGWGTILGQDPDTIGTVYCIYLLQRMYRERFLDQQEVDDLVNRGTWLRGRQQDDGSWEVGPMQSPVEATAWAVVALLACGENPAESPRIQSGIRFLRSLYTPHAGWPSKRGKDQTIWATCFVCYAFSAYIDAMRQLEAQRERERQQRSTTDQRKVFIVHGHTPLRHAVSELLRENDLEPVIVQEQVRGGITSIKERVLRTARDGIAYVIVIYAEDERPGVPLNVTLELGLFLEQFQFQPERICILRQGNVELPSDLLGASYIDVDEQGSWKVELLRELRALKLID